MPLHAEVSMRSLPFEEYTLPSMRAGCPAAMTRSAEYSTVGTGRVAACEGAATAAAQSAKDRVRRLNMTVLPELLYSGAYEAKRRAT